jgi:alanine dehydrogenase
MASNMPATLVLSRSELETLLSMADVNAAIENAFHAYGRGLWDTPTKIIFPQEQYHGDFGAMPAYCHEPEYIAIKWGGVHNHNPSIGLPTTLTQIILSDPATAWPLLLAEGALITQMRTGAAVGIATKYMSRNDARTLAIVGAGAVGRCAAESISLVRELSEIRVADINLEQARLFAREMEPKLGVPVRPVSSVEEAVRDVDIVSVATPSRQAFIMADWIAPGTHINAMGADSPGKQELDPAILLHARIIADNVDQALVYGEVQSAVREGLLPKEQILGHIGQTVAGLLPGRISPEEITVFDGTGLALEDAAVAYLAHKKARALPDGTYSTISLI